MNLPLLFRLDGPDDAADLCRRLEIPEDPGLRGLSAVLPGLDAPLAQAALAGTAMRLVRGQHALALVGDAVSLAVAGRALERLPGGAGAWLRAAALAVDGLPAPLVLGDVTLDFARPAVMGIVNVTPDSFSDGGRHFGAEAAVEHALRLASEGADVLDVGGESTRPKGATYGAGASAVSAAEEIARVVPVIRGLRARTRVPISVDTRKSEVARAAVEAGATLINDVTGLLHDAQVARVAAETGAALCLMHVPADIEQLSHESPSTDPLAEVLGGLHRAVDRALTAGVDRSRLLVDPGIGFGKTAAHNLYLLRHLECFAALGLPLLVGASRKASIAKAALRQPGDAPLPVDGRMAASVGAAVMAFGRGAHLLRVHDVRETVHALRVASAVRCAGR